MSRAPVFHQEVHVLKALVVGLCVLVLVTQAAAAANGEPTAGGRHPAKHGSAKKDARALPLEARLRLKLETARKHLTTIRFFKTHRWLVRSGEHRALALRALRRATRGLASAAREIAHYRRLLRIRETQRDARRLAKAPPRVAICGTFGPYCEQAVAVAWCESRLSTDAQNGQFLGLFQMGSNERRLFGHGQTAHEQAVAAHRYFVFSGHDWSPWSCRWAAY